MELRQPSALVERVLCRRLRVREKNGWGNEATREVKTASRKTERDRGRGADSKSKRGGGH